MNNNIIVNNDTSLNTDVSNNINILNRRIGNSICLDNDSDDSSISDITNLSTNPLNNNSKFNLITNLRVLNINSNQPTFTVSPNMFTINKTLNVAILESNLLKAKSVKEPQVLIGWQVNLSIVITISIFIISYNQIDVC